MHYLYILKSNSSGKYYVGETSDIDKRLTAHKSGRTGFGKRNKDVELVLCKECLDRGQAKEIEAFVKRQKSRLFIEKVIAKKYTLPCSSAGRASGC